MKSKELYFHLDIVEINLKTKYFVIWMTFLMISKKVTETSDKSS